MSEKAVECVACHGYGRVPVDRDGKDKPNIEWVPCGACGGTGRQP